MVSNYKLIFLILALEIWRDNMIKPIAEKIVTEIYNAIHEDRLDVVGEYSLVAIKEIIESFVDVEINTFNTTEVSIISFTFFFFHLTMNYKEIY